MFVAEKTSVPAPVFETPKLAPLITPLMVRSAAAVPSSETENILLAPNATGHTIDAPLFPAPILFTVIFPARVRVPAPLIVETLLAPHTIVKLAQLPATFIVTVIPVLIVTGCAAVGVVAEPATPPEVVAQIGPFQLPEAIANLCPNTLLKKNKLARNKVTTKIVDFKKKHFIINSLNVGSTDIKIRYYATKI